ncbi:MAG: sigma-54 dependent transcriptional regulator [Vicinamibacterales bacterium]|nr:sigma-54 dependent transcriptional regulator [Vicinamibacterales bacterium]
MSAGTPIATLAELERVKAKVLARLGATEDARAHFERAVRMLGVIGHVQARNAAAADFALALGTPRTESGPTHPPGVLETESLFALASNAELLGREAQAALEGSGWLKASALFASRDDDGDLEVLATAGWTECDALRHAEEADPAARLPFGALGDRSFFLLAEPEPTLSARDGLITFRRLIELAQQLEAFREDERRRSSLWPAESSPSHEDGVYVSTETLENFSMAKRVAPSRVPVLLTGETGTGKEVMARVLHRYSDRHEATFLPFNCQGVPRDMLDSQLFGYKRGAFTGANENFSGVIRAADGGTLLLDEIGELALEVQPKLLRFLETGEVHPLGESQPVKVDVRVIAATNAPLEQLVSEGRVREDLYYRLHVVRLRIPPLRERREEIPPLLHQALQRFALEEGKGRLQLADETLEHLLLYSWPGNVRQLTNEVRRLVSLAEIDAVLLPSDLSPEIRAARRTVPATPTAGVPANAAQIAVDLDQPLSHAVSKLERAIISHALATSGGRVEKAARTLKISRKGLFLKRRRLGLGGSAIA